MTKEEFILKLLIKLRDHNIKRSKITSITGDELEYFEFDIIDDTLDYLNVPKNSSYSECEKYEFSGNNLFFRDWYYEVLLCDDNSNQNIKTILNKIINEREL